ILRRNPPPPRAEMAGPDDQRFVRRVGAVLVAEHDGGTPPSGEEGADVVADAVQFLRIGGGDAAALSATAVGAGCDGPGEALTAGSRLHLRAMGGERAGRWCAGVHVADLEMTGEGTATLVAIDGARALARVARRGTTAVATDALPVLGHLHDASLEAVDVPDMPAGSGHPVVPPWAAPPLPRRRTV